MVRTRFALFLIGLCGSLQLACGQDAVVGVTERVIPEPVAALPYINPLYMNQWVALDANQSIGGKLLALDESGASVARPAVEVSLLQKGITVSQVMTDSNGVFRFGDLEPGTYSFVAESEYTFAAFGFHVLPASSGSPTEFEVYAAAISADRAKELINENWVPSNVSSPYTIFESDPLNSKRVIGVAAKVLLQEGDLLGQVSRPGVPISEQDLTGNVAHVVREGRSMTASPVARDGKFRINGLQPGVYDLVVVGEDGMAFVGFEAVSSKQLASKLSQGARLVSVQDTTDTLNVELADTKDFSPVVEEVPPPYVTEEFGVPFADAGFAGPGFGGGGFGGGGGGLGGGGMGGGGGFGGGGIGGLGGLLGIGGLAAGVAALSDDDDFDPQLASLVGP